MSQTATIHATNMFLHAAQLHARTQRRRALTLPKPQCQEHKWRHAVGAASVVPSIPHPAGGRRCRRSSSAKDSSWGRASPGAAPRQPSCLRHEATTSAAVRTYATLCRTHAPSKRMSRKVASCFLLCFFARPVERTTGDGRPDPKTWKGGACCLACPPRQTACV